MKRNIIIAFIAVLFAGQLSAREYGYSKDIQYKNGDDYVQQVCRLDLAYEKGAENRPVIVWYHSGGLTSGRKHIPEALLRDGAVVVGVGYRFATKVSLPEILDDAAAALAWVYANIDDYGGDTSKVIIAGHSAGGYLVNMLALDKQYLKRYDIDPDTQVAAVVPYSGQVITHFAQRRIQGISELTPTIDALAPLYHVRGDAAPFYIISGDREEELYGRYEETAYFARMLKLNGHQNVLFKELDGFNHGDMAEPAHFLLLKYIRNLYGRFE